uniref:Lipid-binding serum glycoprotein C-terminal domain-containing protein n=1 Tax=Parascaris univalens TaxID=6257 RepID=A0A915B1Y4_PARUN
MKNNTLWCIILLLTCEGFESRRSNPKLLSIESSKRWNKKSLQESENFELAKNLVDSYILDSYSDDYEYDNIESSSYSEQNIHKRDEMALGISSNMMNYNLQKLKKLILESSMCADEHMHVNRQQKSVDTNDEEDGSVNNPGIVVRVTQKAFHFVATVSVIY